MHCACCAAGSVAPPADRAADAAAMVPLLQFPGWEWLALALATPVVLWAGWPFHRAQRSTADTRRQRRWTR